jgi:hypothetical protein
MAATIIPKREHFMRLTAKSQNPRALLKWSINELKGYVTNMREKRKPPKRATILK